MKLNYKRTILVGFAFFLICAFWQAYDNTVPLILTNKFGMSQTWSGVIMALDNVLALFLLPLFGHISDKCTHPRGRRTPFIVVGTLIAAVALIALSFADNAQLKRLDKVSAIDDPAALTSSITSRRTPRCCPPAARALFWGINSRRRSSPPSAARPSPRRARPSPIRRTPTTWCRRGRPAPGTRRRPIPARWWCSWGCCSLSC